MRRTPTRLHAVAGPHHGASRCRRVPGSGTTAGPRPGARCRFIYDPLISKLVGLGRRIARMRYRADEACACASTRSSASRRLSPFSAGCSSSRHFEARAFHTGYLDELLQQRQGEFFATTDRRRRGRRGDCRRACAPGVKPAMVAAASRCCSRRRQGFGTRFPAMGSWKAAASGRGAARRDVRDRSRGNRSRHVERRGQTAVSCDGRRVRRGCGQGRPCWSLLVGARAAMRFPSTHARRGRTRLRRHVEWPRGHRPAEGGLERFGARRVAQGHVLEAQTAARMSWRRCPGDRQGAGKVGDVVARPAGTGGRRSDEDGKRAAIASSRHR